MIRKLLFISALFAAGFASAQTFQLMDKNDVSIDGTNHFIGDTPFNLSETKFHVKNMTGSSATYTAKVYEINNMPASDLQVCYGTNCYTADDGVSGAQTNAGSVSLAGGAIDSTFKAAPFTFTWNGSDSAVWRVTIYNLSNPNDSSSSVITWKANATSINELSKEDVKISAYPNPVEDVLNVKYNIDGNVSNANINVFDIVGKKVASHQLMNNKGTLKLDVSSLNAGVYFYSVNVNGQTLKTERVIVK